MKKKLVATLLCVMMSAGLVACGGNSSDSSAPAEETPAASGSSDAADTPDASEAPADDTVYTLKMTYTISGDETIAKVAQEMADDIKEASGGRLILENYPNGELAGDTDALELAANGSNVLTFGTPDFLAAYVPDMGILDGPYLFTDPSEFAKLEASDWCAEERAELETKGIKNLSLGWYFGPRHVIHNTGKEIKTPADLKGVTLRSASSPMRVAMLEAMGATVTQMAWTEVYSGLNQGVMNGCEAPLSTMYNSKLYEVCSDISLTAHIQAIWSVNMSVDVFNSLPADLQTLLTEKVAEYGQKSIEAVQADQEKWQETLEGEGVRFTEVDEAAFAESCKAAYDKVTDYSDGLFDKLKGILAE